MLAPRMRQLHSDRQIRTEQAFFVRSSQSIPYFRLGNKPALCAVLITLLPCVTFDAAHALYFGSLVAPNLTMLIGGCIVSYFGFAVGIVIRSIKKKTGKR